MNVKTSFPRRLPAYGRIMQVEYACIVCNLHTCVYDSMQPVRRLHITIVLQPACIRSGAPALEEAA